jgi:hypothetical protein
MPARDDPRSALTGHPQGDAPTDLPVNFTFGLCIKLFCRSHFLPFSPPLASPPDQPTL